MKKNSLKEFNSKITNWKIFEYSSFCLDKVGSSHRSCSVKKGALKNFAKFARKHLCQALFCHKVAGLRHRPFPMNFAKFLRTPLLQSTSRRRASVISVNSHKKSENISTFFECQHLDTSCMFYHDDHENCGMRYSFNFQLYIEIP